MRLRPKPSFKGQEVLEHGFILISTHNGLGLCVVVGIRERQPSP